MRLLSGRMTMLVFVLFAVLLAPVAPGVEQTARTKKPLRIIATLFPQFDFATIITGGKAHVDLLLPPGTDSHSYEPSPRDLRAIAESDMIIYTGDEMEPWAGRMAAAAAIPGKVLVVEATGGLQLSSYDARQFSDDDHDGHGHSQADDSLDHHHNFDPHIWLDPLAALTMVDTIASACQSLDPDNADFYAYNAEQLRLSIRSLHESFAATVRQARRKTLVFGEGFAFGYFFDRYGLQMVGPYTSCLPGAEPPMSAVASTIDYINGHQVQYIYRDEQTQSRISRVLSEQTGCAELTVDSLHNPPAERLRDGYTYLEGMRSNMAAFAKGLE